MSSIPNDASDNILQRDLLSHQLLNLLSGLGQPGDTFTIESTYITNSNNEIDSPMDSVHPSQEIVQDNTTAEDVEENFEVEENGEEMPLSANNTAPTNSIPIHNLYNEMARLFNFPHIQSPSAFNSGISNLDPSDNLINGNLYSTSAPTTQREIRRGTGRARRQRVPFTIGSQQNRIFDSDVNSDYQNFISSLFNIGQVNPPQAVNINSILSQSLLDPSQNLYKNVISEKGEGEITYLEYKAVDFPEQNACPMTLCDFKEGDRIAKLPCGHIFDTESILKWLKKEDARCPVCRKKLASKEVKKDIKIGANIRMRQGPTNRRLTSQDLISHMLNARLRREEEDELQQAIMASLRDNDRSEDN